jgi:hypothetical protein
MGLQMLLPVILHIFPDTPYRHIHFQSLPYFPTEEQDEMMFPGKFFYMCVPIDRLF